MALVKRHGRSRRYGRPVGGGIDLAPAVGSSFTDPLTDAPGSPAQFWLADGPEMLAKSYGDGDPISNGWPCEITGDEVAQGTGTAQPLFETADTNLNNRHSVIFDGIDDLLFDSSLSVTYTQVYSILVVGYTIDNASNQGWVSRGTATHDRLMHLVTGPFRLRITAGTFLAKLGDHDTVGHVMLGVYNGVSSSIERDGAEDTGNAGSGVPTLFHFGRARSGDYLDGGIAMVATWLSDVRTETGWDDYESNLATHYGTPTP